jgi:hypothetical protein
MMGNALLAVGVVFGRRIIALKEKVAALEEDAQKAQTE